MWNGLEQRNSLEYISIGNYATYFTFPWVLQVFLQKFKFSRVFPETQTIFQIPWVFQVFYVFQVCGDPIRYELEVKCDLNSVSVVRKGFCKKSVFSTFFCLIKLYHIEKSKFVFQVEIKTATTTTSSTTVIIGYIALTFFRPHGGGICKRKVLITLRIWQSFKTNKSYSIITIVLYKVFFLFWHFFETIR